MMSPCTWSDLRNIPYRTDSVSMIPHFQAIVNNFDALHEELLQRKDASCVVSVIDTPQ